MLHFRNTYSNITRLTNITGDYVYAKLFTSIYQGTLRGNSDGLLVFTNLLAHADHTGFADIHPRAISEEVGLPIDRVKAALILLESPDSESRSPEANGCRITRVDDHRDWGWQVVNYVKYRSIRSEEDRREQNRIAQANWRNKNKQSKPPSAEGKQDKPIQKQIHIQKQKKSNTNTVQPPDGVAEKIWSDFLRTRKTKITDTAINGIRREADKAGVTLERALEICCERGWQSFNVDWHNRTKSAQPESFAERDAKIARKRWEEMTGRIHPENLPSFEQGLLK